MFTFNNKKAKLLFVLDAPERKRLFYMQRKRSIVRSLVELIILSQIAQKMAMMNDESYWKQREKMDEMRPMLFERLNKEKRLNKLSYEEFNELEHYIWKKQMAIVSRISPPPKNASLTVNGEKALVKGGVEA